MPNPDLIPEPFAQSGNKNPIPLERAITDPIYRASWKAGFPPDTRLPKDLGGEAPDGLDFNGVLNILSQAVVFLQKGNAYQFDAALAPYPIGALVRSNDNLTTYQSAVPNNSNNPNSNMTGWRVYNGSGFIVDNLTTNDSAKALSAAQGKALQDNKIETTARGTANGVASLGANTLVPVSQLPAATISDAGVLRFATATEVANKANVVAAVTPKNIQDMFVGGVSENDSVTLPSGHILQWGVFITVNNQQASIPQYVNFPKSFTSKVFSVSLSVDALATGGLEVSQLGISEIQLNRFSVYSNYAGKCMFFAIGY